MSQLISLLMEAMKFGFLLIGYGILFLFSWL